MAQPDFPLIAQAHATLSQQFGYCQNIPALDGDAAILAALGHLANQIADVTNQIAALAIEVRAKSVSPSSLSSITNCLLRDHNATARMRNGTIRHRSQPLHPLVD